MFPFDDIIKIHKQVSLHTKLVGLDYNTWFVMEMNLSLTAAGKAVRCTYCFLPVYNKLQLCRVWLSTVWFYQVIQILCDVFFVILNADMSTT